MAQATTLSLSKFTSAVQAAVKAAAQKHTKFHVDPPHGISVSYLIRGFPIPDPIAATVTLGEAQSFANDVAAHIAGAHPEALALAGGGVAPHAAGAVLSVGGHVIIGIPPATQTFLVEK